MSTKKPSLSAALHEASGRRPPGSANQVEPASPRPEVTVSHGRQGTKTISGHFDPAVSRQLRQLALDQNRTVQDLLAESLNDLFVKYQKNPLA